MIPAQENFDPLTTFNPTFELEYFRFGIAHRAGLARAARAAQATRSGTTCCSGSRSCPQKDGIYLAAESQPDLWERARSAAVLEGQAAQRMPEPRSSLVRRRLWPAAGLGRGSRDHAPHAEGGAERLGPAPDLGLGLAHARDDGDAAR